MSRPVNLIADKLAERAALRSQALRIMTICMLAVLASLLIVALTKVATAKNAQRLQNAVAQQRTLEKRKAYLEQSKSTQARSLRELKWAADIRNVNQKWRAVLLELGGHTPDGAFVSQVTTETTPAGQKRLEVSGTALSLEQVASFISNLSRSRRFGTVLLESTEAGEMNGVPTVNFRCSISLGASELK